MSDPQARRLAIVVFDGFTDIDVFLPWDILNRVNRPGWSVRLLGEGAQATSTTGLPVPLHGGLEETAGMDAVLVTSGKGARIKYQDQAFLDALRLDPARQIIGSMCSGALILAAKGLLAGARATTYPTTTHLLEGFGVTVVEEPFVQAGKVATAAGCLAAQELCGWMIEELAGTEARESALREIQPVGRGLFFERERARASAG